MAHFNDREMIKLAYYNNLEYQLDNLQIANY